MFPLSLRFDSWQGNAWFCIDDNQKFSEELIYDLLETMEVGSLCALGGGLPLAIRNLLEHCGDEFKPLMEK